MRHVRLVEAECHRSNEAFVLRRHDPSGTVAGHHPQPFRSSSSPSSPRAPGSCASSESSHCVAVSGTASPSCLAAYGPWRRASSAREPPAYVCAPHSRADDRTA
uniref:Uncharacterized protein n=1 Tax=Anopheles christyi TaxID=43041 RepID=A0A182KHZ6_9DIPT